MFSLQISEIGFITYDMMTYTYIFQSFLYLTYPI